MKSELERSDVVLRDTLACTCCIKSDRNKMSATVNKTNEIVDALTYYHDGIEALEGNLRDVQREQ